MWDRLHRDYFTRRGPRRAGAAAKLVHIAAVVACGNAGERWRRGERRGWVPAAEFDAGEVAALWGFTAAFHAEIELGFAAAEKEGLLLREGADGWWIADYLDWVGDPTSAKRSKRYRERRRGRHGRHSDARDEDTGSEGSGADDVEDGPRHGRHSDARDAAHEEADRTTSELVRHGRHGDARDAGSERSADNDPKPSAPALRVVGSKARHGRHSDARDAATGEGSRDAVGGTVTVTTVTSRQNRGEKNTPDSSRSGVCSSSPPESPPLPPAAATPVAGSAPPRSDEPRTAAGREGGEASGCSAGIASPLGLEWLEAQVEPTTKSLDWFDIRLGEAGVRELLARLHRVSGSNSPLAARARESLLGSGRRRDPAWYRRVRSIVERVESRTDAPTAEELVVEQVQRLADGLREIEQQHIRPVSGAASVLLQAPPADRDDAWVVRARDVVRQAAEIRETLAVTGVGS